MQPFLHLAQSPILDFQRTAGAAFSSFSLNQANKSRLVKEGALAQILSCMRYKDLEVQRDCSFALANIADSVEYQNDVVREGLGSLGCTMPDTRVQRDVARSYSTLSAAVHIHLPIIEKGA